MIKLPRLYTNGKFVGLVHPITVSITQNITPLDTASMVLLKGEELPARSYVELFTPYGSAGMFRVRSPHDAYGEETTTAELEHMISEVGDYVVKEEVSEMMAADAAMKRVFKHYKGGKWKLGNITALGSGQVACSAKYTRVLDSMLSILQQKPECMMAFDFSTSPWTINIVKKGTSVTAEGRLSRNVTSAVVSYDDSELVTRVWYQTFDKNKKATWRSKDASTLSKYGVIEGTVNTSSDMTDDELSATVNTYINEHKEPRISVSIEAVELSQITGESMDKFTIGKLMRLNMVDYGVMVDKNITSIEWGDIYSDSKVVTVNLGDEEDTVVTFLHNLDSKGTGGGGGGRKKKKEEEEWKEFKSKWDVQDSYIEGWVKKSDEHGKILEQAGLKLNSKGLLVYANDYENSLSSRFSVMNNAINMKVAKNGVISAINVSPESIVIQSKRINLDGYVNAKNFSTVLANLSTAHINRLYVDSNMYYPNGVSYGNGVWFLNLTSDGDTYTLTENKLNGDTRKVGSFSRATTLSGAWSSGNYTVTASPQGKTISTGSLTSVSANAHKSGNLLYVPIRAGGVDTGYSAWVNWKNLLTSHSNCVAGVSRYNTSSLTTLYTKSGSTYTSAGSHYWYYKNTNSPLETYYD